VLLNVRVNNYLGHAKTQTNTKQMLAMLELVYLDTSKLHNLWLTLVKIV